MSEELEPCPFCGDSARTYNRSEERREDYHDDFWTVECSNCLASVCESGRSHAVAAWNTRPAPAVQVPEGMVLVPVEPTQEMLCKSGLYDDDTIEVNSAKSLAGQIYRAMLAAAPAPATCSYPDCNCPFDAPADPNWCARGLPKKAPATVTTEAAAQGGGVDVEKVMALVAEYGEAKWSQGDNQYRRGCDSSATFYSEEAGRIRDRIRVLLSASPAGPLDTGNLAADPLYKALDALYSRGWVDHYKGRDHDPRGTQEWQDALDLFRISASPAGVGGFDILKRNAARYQWVRYNAGYTLYCKLFGDVGMREFTDNDLDDAIDRQIRNEAWRPAYQPYLTDNGARWVHDCRNSDRTFLAHLSPCPHCGVAAPAIAKQENGHD